MTEISEQIIEKLNGLDEFQQKRMFHLIQNLENERFAKIVVSMDAIGCFIYHLPSDLLHPDQMFTPGGVDLIDAVRKYIEETHGLQMGRLGVNIVLKSVGSVIPLTPELTTKIGSTKTDSIELSSEEIRKAIALQIRMMLENIREAIPSVLARHHTDTSDAVVILRGEFKYLRGLNQWIHEATGLKVIVE